MTSGYDEGHIYSSEEIMQFRKDPQKMIDHMKSLDAFLNWGWPAFINGSSAQAQERAKIEQRMAEIIKDEHLLKGKCNCVASLNFGPNPIM